MSFRTTINGVQINDLENIQEQLKQKAIGMIKSNLHTMKGASK